MTKAEKSRRQAFIDRVNPPEDLDPKHHPDAEFHEDIPKAQLRMISRMAEQENNQVIQVNHEAEFREILEDDEAPEESVPLSGFETEVISKEILEAQAQAEAEEAEQERIAKIVAEHDARLAAEHQEGEPPGGDDAA